MFNSVHRFQELFQKLSRKALLLDDVLWATYQKMIVPEGPVSCDYIAASESHRDHLLKHFKECALIRAGGGFVSAPDSWYCVLCDRPVELSALSAKRRWEVRRGLKNCTVRRVDARFMARHAWPVIASAIGQEQSNQSVVSEDRFRRAMTITEEFGDIVQYWGVFENQTGQLIAYIQNYLYDNIEVNNTVIKFHPDFLRLYPSYALFYEMNRYYLDEQKFSYVNNGLRGLLHQTNIQEFLIKKFSFKKQSVGLKVHYRPLIGGCISTTYPFRHLLGRMSRSLSALYKLEEINRG